MEFLNITDFDYIHTTPSNHESANFQKMHKLLKPILECEILLFDFGSNSADLHEFIANNFTINSANLPHPKSIPQGEGLSSSKKRIFK